jgi:O-antigen ligase
VFILLRLAGMNSLRDMLFVPGRSLGSMFWTWLVALAFAQLLYNNSLKPYVRSGLALLVASTLYIGFVLAHDWFSGWLPPLVAVAIMIWLYSSKARLLVIAAAALLFLLNIQELLSWFDYNISHYTVYSRQATYPILFELIKSSPILGLGMSNYSHFTPLYPILGWYVRFNSHSQYMDILAQTGLIGLTGFTWLVLEIGRVGWRLRKQVTDPFLRAHVFACLGGLGATLFSGFLGDWFLPYTYNIGMSGFRAAVLAWIFLGGLLAIEQIERRKGEANVLESTAQNRV